MQPVVKAAFVCDYALTSVDGKLSALGIFSHMPMQTLPGSWPRFFVVMILLLDRGTHSISLGITDPMGQPLLPEPARGEVQVDVPGAETNLVIDFNNVLFQHPGIHQVQLFLEGMLLQSIPVNVQALGTEGLAPPPANPYPDA